LHGQFKARFFGFARELLGVPNVNRDSGLEGAARDF
jgi:hypothetical protein